MRDAHVHEGTIQFDHAFTELFNSIKKIVPNKENICLDYTAKEMTAMLVHTDNATTTLLHGLQSMGNLLGASSLSNKEDIMQIGCLLTLIGNLMEALHILRLDCGFQLLTKSENINCG